MKAFLKFLGVLVALAVVLLVVIINFSAVSSSYECPGQFATEGARERATIFFRLERYRWWVGLWSESDGDLRLEIPNEWTYYYGDVAEVGDQMQIRDRGELVGNFSTLSRALTLSTHYGFFEGTCSQTSR